MATLRSGKQVGGSNGGGSGSSGEVDGRDRGAVQAADIKEKALIGVTFSIGFTVGHTVGAAFSRWGSIGWFAASAVYARTLTVANIIFFAVFFQESLPEGRRRRDIGASLTEAWEVINPRALFSVSCVKGLGREAWS
ncbi:major facilitator superfamily domain-containing protein 10-like isoform X3 [Scylla paramamosain]